MLTLTASNTTELLSAIKANQLLILETSGIDLKGIALGEQSQSQMAAHNHLYNILEMWKLWRRKTDSRLPEDGDGGGTGGGVIKQ